MRHFHHVILFYIIAIGWIRGIAAIKLDVGSQGEISQPDSDI
jgi:hypothetical protein